MADLNQIAVNTIRALSMDAIEQAQSGHPGAPMGLAPVGWTLFDRFLKGNPLNPSWFNRDRLVLSAGHASMLLYVLLHISGYDLSVDDLKQFRQWGSRTPGHPEVGVTPGVEASTGPLGQGAATSVGMALAERWLSAHYNRPNFDLIHFNTFAILGDGCMMEGITSEAASLAGHLALGRLVWIYDANQISIEGSTDITFTEAVCDRFAAYGWQTQWVEDANDLEALQQAFAAAVAETQRPSLIAVRSHIAYGSPNLQDSSAAHGAPLGAEEVALTKQALGLDADAVFEVPQVLREYTGQMVSRGVEQEKSWQALWKSYQLAFPAEAAELTLIMNGELPKLKTDFPTYAPDEKGVPGRSVNGDLLNRVAADIPWWIGGSADLGPSNKSIIKNGGWVQKESPDARNIHFGVREQAMGAVANGLALTGMRPFCASFFVFSDYMRSSIRMAALMKLPVFFFFTHDSFFVGEDGPTHQPIEHLAAFRSMPNVDVIRPGDANELVALWQQALKSDRCPGLFVLSRQNMPTLDRASLAPAASAAAGGYVVRDLGEPLQLLFIASGSELSLALQAQEALFRAGVASRVVSMPCREWFDRQSREYRLSVLPPTLRRRMVLEAASSFGWERYLFPDEAGLYSDNAFVCLNDFAASAPAAVLAEHYGFTVDAVVEKANRLLSE